MTKRTINKYQLEFMKNELKSFKELGIITDVQYDSMVETYALKDGINFIKILLIIGALLVGVGILSFIASNWRVLGKPLKFLLIIAAICGADLSAFKLRDKYPKTSRSLTYIGIMLYGAGIFLVGQMFNYGSQFYNAFLLWALGILPIAITLKDRIVFTLSGILLIIYSNVYYFANMEKFPYLMILIVPVLYYLGWKLINSGVITFLSNIIVLNTILLTFMALRADIIFSTAVFFAIGIAMHFTHIPSYGSIFRFQGDIIHGIAGIMLTIPYVWDILSRGDKVLPIIFAVCYGAFLLYLVKRNSLISIVLICALIFRYYADLTYGFMPKSLFFIISGAILIFFGYYFEKTRRKVGLINEKEVNR